MLREKKYKISDEYNRFDNFLKKYNDNYEA